MVNKLEIGKELTQCPAWSWREGMALVDAGSGDKRGRLAQDLQRELYLPLGPADWKTECVPDVQDGATIGAILDILKEGYEHWPYFELRNSGYWNLKRGYYAKIGEGPSQQAALLSALKAKQV